MEYRELGKTGEKISTIGMGTWHFGTYSDQEGRDVEVAALRRGMELGINLIDTAEIYSGGKSEEVVGEAIKGVRDKLFIATKVAQGHLHHDEVVAACKASLKRLGTSYIDLYQVHWPDPKTPIKETMSAMEGLVKDGLIRYIGVSNFSVHETEDARTALSKDDVASNQVEYSLQNRGVESEILPYCGREKVTLIAYSPLARGQISDSVSPSILQKYHLTPAQVMLNWVTRDAQVVAIPKSVHSPRMEENAKSVDVRFDPGDYDRISAGH